MKFINNELRTVTEWNDLYRIEGYGIIGESSEELITKTDFIIRFQEDYLFTPTIKR